MRHDLLFICHPLIGALIDFATETLFASVFILHYVQILFTEEFDVVSHLSQLIFRLFGLLVRNNLGGDGLLHVRDYCCVTGIIAVTALVVRPVVIVYLLRSSWLENG